MSDDDLRTPTEWENDLGVTVIDPDGWRIDAKPYDEPVTRGEFSRRVLSSTCSITARGMEALGVS